MLNWIYLFSFVGLYPMKDMIPSETYHATQEIEQNRAVLIIH